MISFKSAYNVSISFPIKAVGMSSGTLVLNRLDLARNRKQLWENYASIFPTFNMFCDALDDLTQDYHCMVIKNRVLSNKIEDVVFWYKAACHKPFRVGTDAWWRWAERHYNARYEQEEEEKQLANRRQQNVIQRGNRANVKFKVRMYQ